MAQISTSLPQPVIDMLNTLHKATDTPVSRIISQFVIDGIHNLPIEYKLPLMAHAAVDAGHFETTEDAEGALKMMQEKFGDNFQALAFLEVKELA